MPRQRRASHSASLLLILFFSHKLICYIEIAIKIKACGLLKIISCIIGDFTGSSYFFCSIENQIFVCYFLVIIVISYM